MFLLWFSENVKERVYFIVCSFCPLMLNVCFGKLELWQFTHHYLVSASNLSWALPILTRLSLRISLSWIVRAATGESAGPVISGQGSQQVYSLGGLVTSWKTLHSPSTGMLWVYTQQDFPHFLILRASQVSHWSCFHMHFLVVIWIMSCSLNSSEEGMPLSTETRLFYTFPWATALIMWPWCNNDRLLSNRNQESYVPWMEKLLKFTVTTQLQ